MEQAKGRDKATRRKISIVIPDTLRQEATFVAQKERRDVGALPSRLAEWHLKARTGAGR